MGFHFQISDVLLRVHAFGVNIAAVSLKLAPVVEVLKCAEVPLTGCIGVALLPLLEISTAGYFSINCLSRYLSFESPEVMTAGRKQTACQQSGACTHEEHLWGFFTPWDHSYFRLRVDYCQIVLGVTG